MTKKEFIEKWNIGFEDREQEIEFAEEMEKDLNEIYLDQLKHAFDAGRKMQRTNEKGMMWEFSHENFDEYLQSLP